MSTNTRTTPSSAAPGTDLRIRRTRKFLQDALVALMKEKPFQDIQITELTERAQVSRPTFYLHYRSKEDLLLSQVDTVFDAFMEEITIQISHGMIDRKKFSLAFFQNWERHAETLRLVIQASKPDMILERLKEYMDVIFETITAKTRRTQVDARYRECTAGFVAGGAYMLLTLWLSQKEPLSAEQMGLLFYELTGPCESAGATH